MNRPCTRISLLQVLLSCHLYIRKALLTFNCMQCKRRENSFFFFWRVGTELQRSSEYFIVLRICCSHHVSSRSDLSSRVLRPNATLKNYFSRGCKATTKKRMPPSVVYPWQYSSIYHPLEFLVFTLHEPISGHARSCYAELWSYILLFISLSTCDFFIEHENISFEDNASFHIYFGVKCSLAIIIKKTFMSHIIVYKLSICDITAMDGCFSTVRSTTWKECAVLLFSALRKWCAPLKPHHILRRLKIEAFSLSSLYARRKSMTT